MTDKRPFAADLIRDFDAQMAAAPLPSPCIKLCLIDPASGYCRGCWRTLDEIGQWRRASDEQQRRIWLALQARAAAAGRR